MTRHARAVVLVLLTMVVPVFAAAKASAAAKPAPTAKTAGSTKPATPPKPTNTNPAADPTPPAVPDSLPDFDARWDFDHPDSTEAAFRAFLPQAHASGNKDYLAQLLTQIARTQGLQMKFDDATKTLEEAQTLLTPDMRVARVRVLLERGRVWNSSKHQDYAIPLFTAAWDLAREASALGLTVADGYAVDAAHMLAIAQPGDLSLQWNQTAIDYAEASKDPKARKWLGSLYNNQGWDYHGKGDFEKALEVFQKALDARRAEGDPAKIRIAEWCVARTLRSLQRNDEALAIQQRLLSEAQAAGQPDGYIFEEMGECLMALQRPAEARPYFAVAYEMLSKDPWFKRDEPERLERIRKFAGL